MAHGLGLALALALMWWVLSGHTEPLILGLGALTVALAVYLASRMGLIDREGAPYDHLHRRLPYWIWLGGEIAKANLAVVRLALRPDLDITPRLVRAPIQPKSGLGVVVQANSITLTPGTVSVDITDRDILIHAMDSSFAGAEGFEEMGVRTAQAFDRPEQLKQAGGAA